jgi:drug/metabolite transporter (DMT)-like permease
VSKRAVDEIAPLVLLPVQLAVSVIALMIMTWPRGMRVTWSADLWRLGVLGVLNPGVSYALSLLGLAHITASMSVLLWTVEPLLILALAGWFLHEKIARRVAISIGAAFVGVVLVVAKAGMGGNLRE